MSAPDQPGGVHDGSVVARNPAITFSDIDDAIVMMDADKGEYYELGPVAARVWALVETSRPVSEICDLLVADYDVDPATCRGDVLTFLEEARALGILTVQT